MICEKITVGAGTEYPLHGMLTFPDSLSKPVPAVVLVHGSGPSDMDETVMSAALHTQGKWQKRMSP